MSKKYKVEVTRTEVVSKYFTVEASNRQEAIERAEEEASNTEFARSGDPTYEGEVIEDPDECPDCGIPLIEGPNKNECPNCGKFY